MGFEHTSDEPVFREPDFEQRVTVGMYREYARKKKEKGKLSPDEQSHFDAIREQLGFSARNILTNNAMDGAVTSNL